MYVHVLIPRYYFMLAWKKHLPLLVLQITATYCIHVTVDQRVGCTFCPLMAIRQKTCLSRFFSGWTFKELETK